MKIIQPKCWAQTILAALSILQIALNDYYVHSAIVPPPWSDPEKNPCASMPGGWQLLYWAPLKKCFKIFQIGFPCPETMELSPVIASKMNKLKNGMVMTAECRCPPGTAQSAITNRCHKLFDTGPCEKGQFFNPLPDVFGLRVGNRWGTCKIPRTCPKGMISWPKDGKCYMLYSKGPCAKGKLIVMGDDGIAECKCERTQEMLDYFHDIDETCHEHYTKGPCQLNGYIFLPGGHCGCNSHLPHYHEHTQQCYELGTSGPCPPGHIYVIPDNAANSKTQTRAICQCKEGYVRWNDGICYRLYTKGPCENDEFLINSTTCIRNPCKKGYLYFPEQQTCYRIGSQGPCALFQVVIFDFNSRPSIDGISYNGVCGCPGVIKNLNQKCSEPEDNLKENTCESTPGMVELNGNCYKLYSRGPCGPGQWLEPYKITKDDRETNSKAKCKCRPGYKNYDLETNAANNEKSNSNFNWLNSNIVCHPPSVGIARYLNDHKYQFINSGSSVIYFNRTADYNL